MAFSSKELAQARARQLRLDKVHVYEEKKGIHDAVDRMNRYDLTAYNTKSEEMFGSKQQRAKDDRSYKLATALMASSGAMFAGSAIPLIGIVLLVLIWTYYFSSYVINWATEGLVPAADVDRLEQEWWQFAELHDKLEDDPEWAKSPGMIHGVQYPHIAKDARLAYQRDEINAAELEEQLDIALGLKKLVEPEPVVEKEEKDSANALKRKFKEEFKRKVENHKLQILSNHSVPPAFIGNRESDARASRQARIEKLKAKAVRAHGYGDHEGWRKNIQAAAALERIDNSKDVCFHDSPSTCYPTVR